MSHQVIHPGKLGRTNFTLVLPFVLVMRRQVPVEGLLPPEALMTLLTGKGFHLAMSRDMALEVGLVGEPLRAVGALEAADSQVDREDVVIQGRL